MVAVQKIRTIVREITVSAVLQTEHKTLGFGAKLNAVHCKSTS